MTHRVVHFGLSLGVVAFLIGSLVGCDNAPSTDAGPDDAGPDGGPITACGDGTLDPGEACDDANDDDADGCSAACAVESGFLCTGEPSVCAAVCGDGIVAGMEGCDDDGTDDGDGCSASCAVEDGYACTGAPSVCATVCGDGVVAGDEACDDDNTDALDGCSDTCAVEAGVTCTGEPSVCTAVCGDSVIATIEECDTGATGTDDGCSDACAIERGWSCAGEPSVCMTGCGDGITAGTEACDDSDMDDGDGCSMACATELGFSCSGEPSVCNTSCGDSIIAGTEACDTGAIGTDDGCSDICGAEAGYTCTGTPSVCVTTCGDGLVAAVEACDDGNIAQGDGCDHFCALELGFACTGTPSACAQGETLEQVALGGDGGCIRTASGIVGCFGDNTQGEVGNNALGVETFLPADTGIADASLVVAGDQFHCAIRTGGNVWCWGDNDNRQQGLASTIDQAVPQQIIALFGIATMSLGNDHGCAVDAFGQVLCWGDNDNRQLGLGGTSTSDGETPTILTLPTGRTATALALGADHSCALLDDLSVACWGNDASGQLGDGAAGTDNGVPTLVPGLSGLVQIAAGGDNTCARDSVGAVRCWGENGDGQIGDGTTTDRASPTPVTLPAAAADIAVRNGLVCALLTNDEVWCWGQSSDFKTGGGAITDQTAPVLVRGLNGLTLTDVDVGDRGACVMTDTNERYCWGFSEEGQLGIAPLNQLSLTAPITYAGGTPTQLALSGAAYRGQACAVFADTTVECTGAGDTVSVALTTGAVGVFPGFPEHLARPTAIPLFTGLVEGGLGAAFACGRTSIGVFCVGDNAQLQLGQGGTATTDSALPVAVTGLGAVDEVEVGQEFACARTGGAVQCWGDNDNRQSGEASGTADQSVPVTLVGLADATDIELGGNFGCALRTGGVVSCWGDNLAGQLGTGIAGTDSATPAPVVGLPSTPATQLVVGQNHACALAGTELWCWGDNAHGQLGQGTTADSAAPLLVVSDATGVASGFNFVCVTRTGGGVSCWGYGLDGQLGNGGGDVTGLTDYPSPVDFIGASGVTGIETGNSFTCLESVAGWRCAGFRSSGQLGDGTTLEPTRATRVMTL
jgi:cysteine-rich repeat protein